MKRLISPLASLLACITLALTLVAPALAQGTTASSPFTVVATGLNNPRSITIGPNGALYVAEAGKGGPGPCVTGPDGSKECIGLTGSITRIMNGQQHRILGNLSSVAGSDGTSASGPAGIAADSSGNLYVTVQGVDGANLNTFGSLGADLWHVFRVNENCKCQTVANLYTYEASHNPDGREINSDPYSVALVSNGEIVADAAANDLLRVAPDGSISTLAVFPVRMEKGPGGANIPMESVPDAVAVGPDGAYYVGELTGFPFPVGGARVYRVPAGGGQPQVVASGFTNIISLAFGSDGSMYVLEMFKNGLGNVNPQNPSTAAGALIRVAPDGTKTTIASDGLFAPAGLAIASDGSIYVTNFGILPGQGQVVKLNATAGAAGSTLTSTQPVTGQLTGKSAGAFNTYTINYPGGSVVGTIHLTTDTNNPATNNAFGVNVYQGSTKLATMNAAGNPPGTNAVTFSSATQGPVTVQVYNYADGKTVSYQLSLSGITTTGPSVSTTQSSTGGTTSSSGSNSGGGSSLTRGGSVTGTLVGNRGGSYATYTVDYPTASSTQTLTLDFTPSDAASGVYVTVLQNGSTLIKAQGTQESHPGHLTVNYSSTTAGPVQIQIGNFNQNRTISYTLSD